jgi:hypothetical protein
MTKPLGPTFGDEVITAGLGGLPFTWGATDDDINGRENLSAAQNTTLDEVVAAHDSTAEREVKPTPQEQILFDHENRLRTQEGQPPLSLDEFMTTMKGSS